MGKGWNPFAKDNKDPKPEPVKQAPEADWADQWYARAEGGITPDMARELIAKAGGFAGVHIAPRDMIRCLCVLENERQQKGA